MSSAILHIAILALLRTTLIETEGWRELYFDAQALDIGHFLALAGRKVTEDAPRSPACGRWGLGFDAQR